MNVVPEAHAAGPLAPVHLLADEEGAVPRLLDVVVAEYYHTGYSIITPDIVLPEVHVEAALAARRVVAHGEPRPVHLDEEFAIKGNSGI